MASILTFQNWLHAYILEMQPQQYEKTPAFLAHWKQNALLAALAPHEQERLAQWMMPVRLRSEQALDGQHAFEGRAVFPLTAVVTLVSDAEDGSATQVAMVGKEGMLGLSLVTGGEPLARWLVHQAGLALAIEGTTLRAEFAQMPGLARVLLRYMHSLMAQMAQAALCNRHHTIHQQLAKWLLMNADRHECEEVCVTHHVLSELLGVRREGVTEAVARLCAAGAIVSRRGAIKVLDRARLRQFSCGCYRQPNAQPAPALARGQPLAMALAL